jgi:hypothetical protein
MGLVTYSVDKMRVTRPSAKTAEKNPDRLYTVTGTFYSTETDAKGKVTRKDKLTIPSKNVTRAMALTEGFALDIAKGLVTLPEGERGRKAFASLTAEDIAKELLALKNPAPVEDKAEDEPEPTE